MLPGNMQRAWLLITLGLMACVSAETRAELTSDKDMYLDNSSIEEASGVYPIDDDDYSSASGSGADEDIENPDMTTSRLIPRISLTSAAPKVETMTLKTQSITPAQTESPEETDKEEVDISKAEEKLDPAVKSTDVYTEKHSDNLFKRTEVLAGELPAVSSGKEPKEAFLGQVAPSGQVEACCIVLAFWKQSPGFLFAKVRGYDYFVYFLLTPLVHPSVSH